LNFLGVRIWTLSKLGFKNGDHGTYSERIENISLLGGICISY
jgi:hypothetical protein